LPFFKVDDWIYHVRDRRGNFPPLAGIAAKGPTTPMAEQGEDRRGHAHIKKRSKWRGYGFFLKWQLD